MALELKALSFFRQFPKQPCETLIADPLTGELLVLGCDAAVVERNLSVDDLEGLPALRRTIQELEAILESDSASEPVKAEVQRELEEIYAYEKENPLHTTDVAHKAVRAVREAIRHFHRNLVTANSPDGTPDPILRQFAFHILRHLLIPSARYSNAGRGRTKTGVAGCFTYEPPLGVSWTA